MKKKLLLHTCCAPCGTHCVKELMQDYDVTMFFYNPNIHPYGEYEKRLENGRVVSKELGVSIIEPEYEPNEWLEMIKGFEEAPEGGRRCKICFQMRLHRTAEYAKEHGFDAFTTTMTISPHKDAKIINELGESSAKKFNVEWVHSDFKKKDGFKRSTELSKKMKLYRQNYCGCFYSVRAEQEK
jgi:predicted adenine nucleotide alpha hydrolase (AANH) superfamily ATPase